MHIYSCTLRVSGLVDFLNGYVCISRAMLKNILIVTRAIFDVQIFLSAFLMDIRFFIRATCSLNINLIDYKKYLLITYEILFLTQGKLASALKYF